MIISLLLIALSAVLGVQVWFLVIRIMFSIGGGDIFTETHYDALIYYSVILLAIAVVYFFFARHLLERKNELLLIACFATSIVSFVLTPLF